MPWSSPRRITGTRIIAIAACKAGKDVYCEKPLSLTIHEARAMVKAARKYDRVFQTGSMQRSSSEFRKACELVRNGRLGKIKQVIVDVGPPSVPCDLPEEPMEPGLNWDLWLGPAPTAALQLGAQPARRAYALPQLAQLPRILRAA